MSAKPYGVVYVGINSVNGKQYVGQTIANDPEKYFRGHFEKAAQGRGHCIHDAIRLYGPESFKFSVVGYADDRQALNLLEDFLILTLGTLAPRGYNYKRGGSAGPLSNISVKKMRATLLLSGTRKSTNSDPAVIAKMNAGRARRLEQPGQREKLRAIQKEVHSRPEVKAKISASLLIALAKPETRAKRAATLARPEVLARMGAAHKGKRWINNGLASTTIKQGVEVPEGWVLGRLWPPRK